MWKFVFYVSFLNLKSNFRYSSLSPEKIEVQSRVNLQFPGKISLKLDST